MALNDLELLEVQMFSEFRVISQILEATTAKRMKIDLYCQPAKCTFQWCIDYIDIAGRSSARGRQPEYSGRKWRFSTSRRENIPQTVSNAATITINH